MKILIINGPNINMLGIREVALYGNETYHDLVKKIEDFCRDNEIEVECFQSNYEGAIVEKIQLAYGVVDGIVINPAAYTHTSIAILDALKTVGIPSVEVHISAVEKREAFRQISFVREYCETTITGKGTQGYIEAIQVLMKR